MQPDQDGQKLKNIEESRAEIEWLFNESPIGYYNEPLSELQFV